MRTRPVWRKAHRARGLVRRRRERQKPRNTGLSSTLDEAVAASGHQRLRVVEVGDGVHAGLARTHPAQTLLLLTRLVVEEREHGL